MWPHLERDAQKATRSCAKRTVPEASKHKRDAHGPPHREHLNVTMLKARCARGHEVMREAHSTTESEQQARCAQATTSRYRRDAHRTATSKYKREAHNDKGHYTRPEHHRPSHAAQNAKVATDRQARHTRMITVYTHAKDVWRQHPICELNSRPRCLATPAPAKAVSMAPRLA